MLRPRSHWLALESRKLFDGAALVEAAHAAPARVEALNPAAATTDV
ncbi:hypothetical protein [Variovorax sp. PAMC 28711]|nr:hypothetical protein [Variovorax sp. PAMC 28711]